MRKKTLKFKLRLRLRVTLELVRLKNSIYSSVIELYNHDLIESRRFISQKNENSNNQNDVLSF